MLQNDRNNEEQSVRPYERTGSETHIRSLKVLQHGNDDEYPQTIARFSDFSQYQSKNHGLFYRKSCTGRFFSKKVLISMALLLVAGIGSFVFFFGYGGMRENNFSKNSVVSDDFQVAPDSGQVAANGSKGQVAQTPAELVSFASPMITSNQEQNILSSDLPGEFDSLPDFSMLSENSRKENSVATNSDSPLTTQNNLSSSPQSSQPFQTTSSLKTSSFPEVRQSDIPDWNDLAQKRPKQVATSTSYPETPFNSSISNAKSSTDLPPLNLPINNSNIDLTQNSAIPTNSISSVASDSLSGNPPQINVSNSVDKNNWNRSSSHYPGSYDNINNVSNLNNSNNLSGPNNVIYSSNMGNVNAGINQNSENNFNNGNNDASPEIDHGQQIAFNRYPQLNSSSPLPSGGFQGYQKESGMAVSASQSQKNYSSRNVTNSAPTGEFSSFPHNSGMYPSEYPNSQVPLEGATRHPSETWQEQNNNQSNPVTQNQVRPIRSQIPQQENGLLYQPTGYAPTTAETIRNSQFTGQSIPSEMNTIRNGTDNNTSVQNNQQVSRFQGYSIQPDRNPINYSSNTDLYDNNRTLH